MTDSVHVYAGECTTTFRSTDAEPHSQRGRVVVVCKPDDTLLVHDACGYQPVAWLTRADAVYRETDGDGGFALVAVKDDERLRVESQGRDPCHAAHRASQAGDPVGTCPDCSGTLVRARGDVICLDCDVAHSLPRATTVLDSTCDCGLPRIAVRRGRRFELCLDRECEGLDAAVREAFDREWRCPTCTDEDEEPADLRVVRERTLFLRCENHPDCETSFALPDDEIVGDCGCGLPLVEGDDGRRCLDRGCEGR